MLTSSTFNFYGLRITIRLDFEWSYLVRFHLRSWEPMRSTKYNSWIIKFDEPVVYIDSLKNINSSLI